MKFKQVKIQAFRAYNKVEDGTFDFNLSQAPAEDIADFVSIYAPNGFGKTSFYDAVEYGFTESVSRFLKNLKLNTDAAKSERFIATTKKGQNILRNRFATDDLNTEIKIYTTNSTKPIEKSVPKNKRKDGTDFDFDESKVKNKYFQSVILSQEWIDAFLKVDDPYDRYNKFVDYFGDVSIDSYYRKLVELIALNEKRIEEIKKTLQGIQTELNFDGDKDILRKINDKIIELKTLNEAINPINESFDEKESLNLSNWISERISDIGFEKQKLEFLSGYINTVFSGNNERKDLETYLDSKLKFEGLKIKETTLKANIDQFLFLQKLSVELNNISSILENLLKEKSSSEEIQKLFPSYLRIEEEIRNKEKELEGLKSSLTTINSTISTLKIKDKSIEATIENLNSQISLLEVQIEKLPGLLIKFNNDEKSRKEIQARLTAEEEQLKQIERSENIIQLEVSTLNNALDDLKKNILPSSFDKEFTSLSELILGIENVTKELNQKKEELNLVNTRIKDQEGFNRDIAQFIEKGAEIIDKNQATACPLCSHEYSSYTELADKVAKNSLLSSLLSGLLEDRSKIEKLIAEYTLELEKQREKLINALNLRLQEKNDKISDLKKEIFKSKESKEKLADQQNEILSGLKDYNSILSSLSHEEYEAKINADLATLRNNLRQAIEDLAKCKADLNDENIKETVSNERIKLFNEETEKLKQNGERLKITQYFGETFPNEKIELTVLNAKIQQQTQAINDNKLKRDDLLSQISRINELLKDTTEELEKKEIELVSKTLEGLRQIIISFEQDVNSTLSLSIEKLDREALIIELNRKRANNKGEIEICDRKVKEYNLLTELKKNVEPFLKYERAKKTELELKGRMTFLKETLNKSLLDEKQRVTEYLDEQINSFFYQDLINDLYRRIDPHPDYKKIKFICDFKDDKPKLNICLYKDGSDDLIIPNLYFSTAQLNILSLSIFLAKALNAKDNDGNPINCIFIDDPIQSMDSINILSTIDLFRSLVINEKKQIILSTHDENFHSLLKKKMPPALFKAKYLELESFGKVKPDV